MGKAKFADVWLVRAGCTQWDQEGRIVGATDLPTCQAGLEAARKAAAVLSNETISSVLSAGSEAAQTTAAMISDATEARVRVLDNLGELGLGLWEGTLACDIEGRCPTAYRQWKADPSSVIPPEGEVFEDALARVSESLTSAIHKYLKAGQGLVIVVGPTVFGLVKCWLQKRPATDLWELIEDNRSFDRLSLNCSTMVATSTVGPPGRSEQGASAESRSAGLAPPSDRRGSTPVQTARRS